MVVSATLRSARLNLGVKQGVVATGGNMSASKLSKLERGLALPQQRDVELLADLYGLRPTEKAWLILLTRQAQQPPEWQRAGLVVPPFMGQLVGLEPAAERLWTFEADLISGLLQTEGYMRAVMASSQPPLDAGEIEERVELRLYRQAKLFANLPECIFVLDESMLRRRIGSRETMVEQLDRLIEVAENPLIQIRVLPLDGEQVLTGVCSMTRLEFGREATGLPSVIYLEVGDTGKYFVKGAEPEEKDAPSFERHSTTLTMLLGETAGREQSLELLKEARQRFAR
ncbi:helix-turn-helix domain-containing protein [Streptomyces sp. CBMA156]|uniref:helix-turn-helix domain-containing protein n=1 Tax=Streptomyces sp. CBMA156 TaxID=1930280 RepID=UPI0016620922|nr:Scr1 family TA system antitoxin-like transcriptional regulator [Streptomyces sp. CBMA156]MBD0670469.1 hypothetical protein [Streptomyces sp. CBMA156]